MKTLKDFLIDGGVKGKKFICKGAPSETPTPYEVLRIEVGRDLYTTCYVRWDSKPDEESPQNLAWLLDDKLYKGEKK